LGYLKRDVRVVVFQRLAGLVLVVASSVACTGSEHQIFQPSAALRSEDVAAPADSAGNDNRDDTGAGAEPMPDAGDPAAQDVPLEYLEPILDPNVKFEWTETLPGRGTCRAGTYVGSFSCVTNTFPPLPIDGKLAFTLEGSSEEQLLRITEGRISDLGDVLFSAELDGELRCLEHSFSAVTVNGMAVDWAAPQVIGQPFVPTFRSFDTTIEGNFDDQALVISGDWLMVNDTGDLCDGQFSTTAAP
jgi:hypothetical protein